MAAVYDLSLWASPDWVWWVGVVICLMLLADVCGKQSRQRKEEREKGRSCAGLRSTKQPPHAAASAYQSTSR